MSLAWVHVEGHEDYCAVCFGLEPCDCKPVPKAWQAACWAGFIMFLAWYAVALYKLGEWIERSVFPWIARLFQ